MPTRDGSDETRLYTAVKWSEDGNVVFVVHNLWYADVAQSYYLPSDVTAAIGMDLQASYRLVDVFTGRATGACRSGSELAWDFYVSLPAATRLQWLRLERC